MRVAELIAELEQYDGDMEVRYAYDYGDRCHTMVAPEVSTVSIGKTKYSAYVDEQALDTDDEDEDNLDCVILT